MGMTARGKKRLTLLIGVFVIAAAGIAVAVVVRGQVRAHLMEEALAEGRAAYEAGDYETAMRRIGFYVGRADDNPETMDAEALYLLADARRREPMARGQHLVQAAGLARRAADLMPGDPRPLRMLLELYPALGFGNETLDAADRLLEIEPGDLDAMLLRTEMLAAVGRRAEATESARETLERHPGSNAARSQMVRLMLLDGAEIDEVVAFVEEQARTRPQDLGAQLLLADWQSRVGLASEAASTLLEARELSIETARHLESFVLLLDRIRIGQADDDRSSVEVADALLAEHMDDDALGPAAARIKADRQWRRGDEAGAMAALRPLVADPGEAADETLGLATLMAMEMEELDLISTLREHLDARVSDEARHWSALAAGRLALMEGDLPEAIARLDEAAQLGDAPRLELIAFWRGRALELQGERASALGEYREAVRRSPTWQLARAELITELLGRGRVEEALREAELFTGFAPNASPSGELGLAFSRLFASAVEAGGVGQITVESAITNLGENARRAPASGDLAALYARALAAAGRTAEAEAEIDRIVEGRLRISPDLLRELYNIARQRDLAGAGELSALAGEMFAGNPDVLLLRAMEAARAGRVDEGRAMFRDAIASAGEEASRLSLRRAFARFLVLVDDPEGLDLLHELADEHTDNARVQMDLLEVDAAWTDERMITDAINRLGAVTDEGTGYRIYDARRLLTFLPAEGQDRERALAEAFERLGPLLRSEPPVTPALLLGAEAELLEGDASEAIELLERAVEYEPWRSGVYPRLIEMLQASGRSVDAERRLRDYTQRDDLTDAARRRRVELLMTQGLWSLAVDDAEALADGGAQELHLLARARAGAGDIDGAAEAYATLLASGEADAQAVAAAADLFARRDGFEEGLAALDALPSSLTEEQRALQIAAFHERHGRTTEAERRYAEAVETYGGASSWAEFARMRVRRGDLSEATTVIEEGLAAHPDDSQLRALHQLVNGVEGVDLRPDELAAIAGSLVDERTREAFERLVAAEAALQSDRQAGLGALRDLVSASPTFLPARRLLVVMLLRGPDPDDRTATEREEERNEAVLLARAGMTAMPANARAAQLAYEALNLVGRREQALAAAREWRSRTPVDAFLPDLAIADLLLRGGAAEEALAVLTPWRDRLEEEATEQRPLGLNLLGRALAATGRADEAHALLWDRAQESVVWRGVYLTVAGAVSEASDADAWIERLDALLTTPVERISLANVAFTAASRAPSPERFERVLALAAPLADDASYGLAAMMLAGVSAEQLGDLDAAMGWYRRAIEAGHEEPVAYNNLAYLQYSEGGSVEEAAELAQRAVELGESQGRSAVERATFHDTLAEILASMDRTADAETHYRRAVELAPAEARYRVGLAEALVNQGRVQPAQAEMIRAESLLQGRIDEALERRLRELQETIDGMG